MTSSSNRYLYVAPSLAEVGIVTDDRLATFTERHKLPSFEEPPLASVASLAEEFARPGLAGIIFALEHGVPRKGVLRLTWQLLRSGRAVFFFWPREHAFERVDRHRLRSSVRLWVAYQAHAWHERRKARKLSKRAASLPLQAEAASRVLRACGDALATLIQKANPVEIPRSAIPRPDRPSKGSAIYLRTDYWARLVSGGSYGHTCYQAKALSKVVDNLICVTGSRFPLLDELGLRQVVVRPPTSTASEIDLLAANRYYESALRPLFEALRPNFVIERLCLGNYTGAKLCHELGIPYIAEFNGSEISMQRSFGGQGFEHEELLLAAENAAFKQATLISVVSKHVRDDLIRRGVDEFRILVNPNGVDLDAYRPPTTAEAEAVRAELGLRPADRVVGFIGTFGGWHGVEVLAEAMPEICARAPDAKFLLIGDGPLKHLVNKVVEERRLADRVIDVGRVDQREGARLLRAANILVSPHSAHMVDSPFFGSPTKLFEYMAMGAGIVASDLEQIGEVLSPALRVGALERAVTNERAVLCKPGSVSEFVEGVIFLVGRPEVAMQLGTNAREAVERYYSWDQHVRNYWTFLAEGAADGYTRDLALKRSLTTS